jgi:hypothetical protein
VPHPRAPRLVIAFSKGVLRKPFECKVSLGGAASERHVTARNSTPSSSDCNASRGGGRPEERDVTRVARAPKPARTGLRAEQVGDGKCRLSSCKPCDRDRCAPHRSATSMATRLLTATGRRRRERGERRGKGVSQRASSRVRRRNRRAQRRGTAARAFCRLGARVTYARRQRHAPRG